MGPADSLGKLNVSEGGIYHSVTSFWKQAGSI